MHTPIFEDDSEESDFSLAQRAAAANRSTWTSVAVNSCLTVMQVAAGLFSNSQGLVADGIHSLSDLLSDFVVLVATHKSREEPDASHPYGHQRFETAASMVLGVLLLSVGIGMLWAAIQKLDHPESILTVHVSAIWVAGLALVAKEILFRYMLRVAKQLRSSMLVANAWHARSDAASSLVVGVGIAGNLAGLPILDPIAAALVGFMVTRMGWEFAWDALHDLMDRAIDEKELDSIRTTLLATPGIKGLHDIKTRKMGDMVLVDVHIEVDGSLTVQAGHDIAADARKRVMMSHRVLGVMTHVDAHDQPDLDHELVSRSTR